MEPKSLGAQSTPEDTAGLTLMPTYTNTEKAMKQDLVTHGTKMKWTLGAGKMAP